MTYLWLNAAFTIGALGLAHLLRGKTNLRLVVIAAILMTVISIIGDSFIVSSGIVSYDPTKILGLRIGSAPIEDFAYAVVAAFIVPVLWNLLGKRK